MWKKANLLIELQNNKRFNKLYDVGIILLTIVAVAIALLELLVNLAEAKILVLNGLNNIIVILFAIDYFTRLYFAENKLKFAKENIIDLISIIPLNTIFQAVRLLRITRILKFTKFLKLFRSVVLISKFKIKIEKFLKTNNFMYVLITTITIVFIGALGFSITEGKPLKDALWWSFVTVSTVGYGDISPTSTIGRLIASFLMVAGIGFLGMLTGTISTFFIKEEKITSTYKNEIIEVIVGKLSSFDELSNEELDDICNTLKAVKRVQ